MKKYLVLGTEVRRLPPSVGVRTSADKLRLEIVRIDPDEEELAYLRGSHADVNMDSTPEVAAEVVANVSEAFTKLRGLADVSREMLVTVGTLTAAAKVRAPSRLPEPDAILDADQVAAIFAGHDDFSARTVTDLCARGDIPGAKKIGRQWRIPGWGLRQLMGVDDGIKKGR